MKTIFICTFVLCCVFLKHSMGQFWFPQGAACISRGYTSVAVADEWSASNNQAGMAALQHPVAGLYYQNSYLMRELSSQAICVTYPTGYGTFGTTMNYSGNSTLNTWKAGLAYARTFSGLVSAGLQLDLIGMHISEGLGSGLTGTFEAGLQFRISKSLTIGTHVFNPVCASFGNRHDNPVPVILRTGLWYSFSGKLNLSAEIMKSSFAPIEFHSGLEYEINRQVTARLGAATAPFRYTLGCGFRLDRFSLDVSASYHELLGFSPQSSLQYRFGNVPVSGKRISR